MKLNNIKKQQFASWLLNITGGDQPCRVCKNIEFAILDDVFYLKAVEGPGAYPCVGLICTTCSNIQTFEASASGVMDTPTEIEGIVCQKCYRVEATMRKGDDEIEVCSECYNDD